MARIISRRYPVGDSRPGDELRALGVRIVGIQAMAADGATGYLTINADVWVVPQGGLTLGCTDMLREEPPTLSVTGAPVYITWRVAYRGEEGGGC